MADQIADGPDVRMSWSRTGTRSRCRAGLAHGHASLTMTQRYAHLSPDHLRSEVAKTERLTNSGAVSTRSAQSVVYEVTTREGAAATI